MALTEKQKKENAELKKRNAANAKIKKDKEAENQRFDETVEELEAEIEEFEALIKKPKHKITFYGC